MQYGRPLTQNSSGNDQKQLDQPESGDKIIRTSNKRIFLHQLATVGEVPN